MHINLKVGPFKLFEAFNAVLLTDSYNHYLKISKLSSRLSVQLRLSKEPSVVEKAL